MDKQYICQVCNKTYSTPSSLSNHKKLYHTEKDTTDDVAQKYPCRYCDKSYTIYQTRWAHEQKCKVSVKEPKLEIDNSDKEKEQIKAERDAYMKTIIKLQDRLIKTNRISQKSFNVLTEQQKKQIMNSKFGALDKLVEMTHCGPYNQFKNVIITNLKDEFAYKYDSTRGFFVAVKKNDVIKDIIEYRIYNISEIYDEMENGNKIDAKKNGSTEVYEPM